VINRATALEKGGKEKEAAALLRNALNDTLILNNRIAKNTAQFNLYLYTDSLPVLQEAWKGLDGDLDEETMRPIYGGFLIKEYARRGMTDSILSLLPRVEADSAALDDRRQALDYWFNLAEGYRAIGNDKRAAELFSKADNQRWKDIEDENLEQVNTLQLRREIDEAIHKMEIKRKDRTIWLLVALAVCIAVAAGVIIFYRRQLERHRREKIQASLAEEQAKRKTIALEIAVEENRRLSENIREALETLEKKGLVSRSATGNLEATLKTMEISQGSQDSFVSTFSDVNPGFLEALDRKYPNLTKTERRLAIYISLELDNKHISRLTGIRPESVKQARWRLRSKLGLPEDVSLEDEMKALSVKS
ncbi:MAG: hypothetical protein K2J70_05665, partial [Muribaculaceae bacterium]|nr:hypothetical protein [Muribaculaceae bacterium]